MSDEFTSPRPGHRVPGLFVPHLEAFVAQTGADVDTLYAAAGISRGVFRADEDSLSEEQFYALVKQAESMSQEPAFGLVIGQQFNVGSFGLISRALMSCATLRDFARMLERYSVLVLPLVRFSTHETKEHFVIEVNAVSRYPDLNRLIFEAVISLSRKVTHLLAARNIVVLAVTCQFEAPAYAPVLRREVKGEFTFGAQQNRIYLQRTDADVELLTANPTDARVTMEECEKELLRSRQTQTLQDQVLGQIRYYLDTCPSSAEIAARLNMTDRTFRRRLASEGSSYRALLQSVRHEMATYYLEHTRLQVAQIAQKLGYAETSNFRAAFRSWTGVSPRQWRQSRVAASRAVEPQGE